MFIKVSAQSIRLETNAFTIRKLKEADYMSFLDYVGSDGDEKSLKAFRDCIDYDDSLAMFINEEIGAMFLLYPEDNDQLSEIEEEGIALGFTAKPAVFEEGLLTIAVGMLTDHLLEEEVDFVLGKVGKDNTNTFKVFSFNNFTIVDQDQNSYYLAKIY